MSWQTALQKNQRAGVVTNEKFLLPQFGNYVDHQALFGERLSRVHPAPPRIWGLRPAIYNATIPRLAERVSGLANGLNLLDGPEIKDYAASNFLDEAATVKEITRGLTRYTASPSHAECLCTCIHAKCERPEIGFID